MKFLKRPVEPFYITQNFAGNIPCVEIKPSIPLSKRHVVNGADNKTCPVGYEKLYPLLGLPKGHNGLDLRATHGQPIYASCDGWVEEVQTEEPRGLGIGIISTELFPCIELNGDNVQFKIRNWHMKSFEVKKDDYVKKGQLIGYADNTGHSSGDHDHFEIKPVKVKNGKVTNLLQDNGFYGAVDPLPYMEDEVTPPFKFTRTLLFGETSDDVKKLQEVLIKIGLLDIPKPTRFYGNLTRVGVMRLQNLSGIPTNYGFAVGPLTKARLNELLNK